MLAKDIIKDIMEQKQTKNAEMADAMSISPAALWDRLNNPKSNNITVKKFNDMLRYLGFELVVLPRARANKIDGAVLVTDHDKE